MKLSVDFRLLKERYLGEASRKPWVAEKRLAELAPFLPPETADIVRRAVASLMDYQDPDYALVYLNRVGRYAGPDKEPCAFLAELASRMDIRMRYIDPPSVARATLTDDEEGNASRTCRVSFCLCDLVGMLPPNAADTALQMMAYLRLSRQAIVLRLSSQAGWKRRWTEFWALLRYARTYSRRAKTENAWVERWLHMIDRVHASQPEAVMGMVQTADIIGGSGADYHQGIANWNLIVDRLAKPVCDEAIEPVDLAAALRAVLHAAVDSPEPAELDNQIGRQIVFYSLRLRTA